MKSQQFVLLRINKSKVDHLPANQPKDSVSSLDSLIFISLITKAPLEDAAMPILHMPAIVCSLVEETVA